MRCLLGAAVDSSQLLDRERLRARCMGGVCDGILGPSSWLREHHHPNSP